MSLNDGITSRAAKLAAPTLALSPMQKTYRLAGIYLDILQGRGAGTGWDLSGETAAVASVIRHIKQPVIFDVGASFGHWASSIAQHLQATDPTFYLFEPQSVCQNALRRLPLPRKTLVQAALSDSAGEGSLNGDAPGSGASSLYERHDTYFGDMNLHKETVPITTLDTVIRTHGVTRIDLLKLDIEGAELAALHGSRDSLNAGLISAIAFEFGSANIYSRCFFRDFWELLTPLEYRISRIAPGGRLLPVVSYTEELEHFRGVSNYVAVRATRTT